MAYFRCGQGGGSSLTIQISTTSESLYGQTITISKSGSTVGTTTFDNTGNAEYTVDEAGTYTVSTTVSGTTYSDTVEVTDTFEASIEAGFNYHTWLAEGDVSDTYSDLAEVLADELAVRKLMTIHDAVDYLASFTSDDTSVIAILNNDYAAKWISLTDYAMDVLEAAYGTLMGSIGKYGYGEWAILDSTTTPVTWGAKGCVPIMTSNTAPYGEAIRSGVSSSSYEAWKAFDGDDVSHWHSASSSALQYIGYKFTNPVYVKKTRIFLEVSSTIERAEKLIIQGSNDNSTWVDITENVKSSFIVGWNEFPTTKNGAYFLYYRANLGTCEAVSIDSLQFYGRSLKVSVPTMTGNTSPYGEAIGGASNYEAYRAFIGFLAPLTSNSHGARNPDGYFGYKFSSPVRVTFVRLNALAVSGSTSFPAGVTLKGANSDGVWHDIATFNIPSLSIVVSQFANAGDYTDYGVFIPNVYGNGFRLEMFGVDYSEREWDTEHPRHYIYDHGVELDATSIIVSGSGASCVKKPSEIEIVCVDGSKSEFNTDSKIDLTNYSLLRAYSGLIAEYTGSAYSVWIAVSPTKSNDGSIVSQTNWGYSGMVSKNARYNHNLDVSSFNTECYVGAGKNNNNGKETIEELWLE